MNAEQLRKRVGLLHRLRPLPIRLSVDGRKLAQHDDWWRLEKVSKGYIMITNISTGHSKELSSDNVREFRGPDFLMLKCYLRICARKVEIDPF